MILRHILEETRTRDTRPEPCRCQAPDCSNFTRHRKPFCSDHVMLMPYAPVVAAIADRQARDEVGVLAGKKITLNNTVISDIFSLLSSGPVTRRGLRAAGFSYTTILSVTGYLVKRGLVCKEDRVSKPHPREKPKIEEWYWLCDDVEWEPVRPGSPMRVTNRRIEKRLATTRCRTERQKQERVAAETMAETKTAC